MGNIVHGVTTPQFSDSEVTFPFYLSRDTTTSFYENNIESAFRCAIAIAIAFSCVLGRVGQLECWFVCVIGTIGYELNRQLCYRKFQEYNDLGGDPFGSMYIFGFGGFMGLAMGIVLSLREKKNETSTAFHPNYTANQFTSSYALLGSAFLITTLPFLIATRHNDATNNTFLEYTPLLCIIMSISGSTLTTMAFCLLFKGKLIIRYLIYGPVAGAVIGGAASYYTSNPVYALVIGVIGGFVQVIAMWLKQKLIQGGSLATTSSFSVFGIQGILGSSIAIGWKEII